MVVRKFQPIIRSQCNDWPNVRSVIPTWKPPPDISLPHPGDQEE